MTMIVSATLGVADLDRATRFYDAVLAPLGHRRRDDAAPGWAGYGPSYDAGVSLWLCQPFDGGGPSPGNGGMPAFRAGCARRVRDFHRAALAAGGQDEGAPGVRAM